MNEVPPVHLHGFVFAVHPTTRGFAWVLFESPRKPVAWAIVHARPGRNKHLASRFEALIDKYEPAVVVFEAFDDRVAKRSERIQELCRMMLREAEERAIDTPIFDREAIKIAFAEFGASSRCEIAHVIAQRIDGFSHRLPRERKLGDSEDVRQSLFDAAALALTYFTYRGQPD
jgi:hypothetical protein